MYVYTQIFIDFVYLLVMNTHEFHDTREPLWYVMIPQFKREERYK